jgi:pullulanase
MIRKALKMNVSQLNDIAVFSDDLRDAIKGHVFTKTDKGFVNGGQGLGRIDQVRDCGLGACTGMLIIRP